MDLVKVPKCGKIAQDGITQAKEHVPPISEQALLLLNLTVKRLYCL